MKVKVKEKVARNTIHMSEMQVGELGVIKDSSRDDVVLATFSCVVSLTKPSSTWRQPRNGARRGYKVRLLEPGDKVTLKVTP